MHGVTRTKRVTDPLDDKVKAQIVGRNRMDYVTSGSEHSARGYDDVTVSPNFSELIFGGGEGEAPPPEMHDSDDSDSDLSLHELSLRNVDAVKIKPILLDYTDEFQNVLRAHVLSALQLQMFCCVKSDKSVIRRNVMATLRERGYDAAICKTKWESCGGGLTAGNYEFIDVLASDSSSTRYFVDLDFASEFEIARPTASYERLLQYVPAVFVGKIEDVKQVLRAMSDAARRSLKNGGLHLPPWRKHRFMQNKWLGAYRRTTNIFPEAFASPSASVVKQSSVVKCRAVGFASAVNGGSKLFSAAARTR